MRCNIYANKNEDVSHVLDSRKMTRIVPTTEAQ